MKIQNCPLCQSVAENIYDKFAKCSTGWPKACSFANGGGMLIEDWNRIRIAPDDGKLSRYDLTKGNFQCDENAIFSEFKDWMNPRYSDDK